MRRRESAGVGSAGAVSLAGRLAGTARRHWMLGVLLTGGAILRIVAQLAYRPALLYADSHRYLAFNPFDPRGLSPIGYSLLARPAVWLHEVSLIPLAQHVLALGLAALIYVLLLRWRTPRWLAALATAPLLLDAYWLQMEHHVMAETAFVALVVGGVALLTWWRDPPPWWALLGAGLLLGAAPTTRMIGLVLIVPAVGWVLLTVGSWWRKAVAAGLVVVGFALPLVAYAAWYAQVGGQFRLTPSWLRPRTLYVRTSQIADCPGLELPPPVRQLCPTPAEIALLRNDDFNHRQASPLNMYREWGGIGRHEAASIFGRAVVRHQPLDVAGAVLHDLWQGFATWEKRTLPDDMPVERWRFPPEEFRPYLPTHEQVLAAVGSDYDEPVVVEPLARLLRGYQLSVGFTPGPVLLLALLASVGGGAVALRGGRRRLGGAALLWGLAGLALVGGSVLYLFSWRYWLPALVLLPPGGALGLRALTDRFGTGYTPGGAPGHATDRGPGDAEGWAPDGDPAHAAALRRFEDRYGRDVSFAPLVVLIAAYNEEAAIGGVLEGIPEQVHGVATDTLVVVDGATDDTAAVAGAHGAYVCEATVNRGKGAALWLGYHIARRGGARYIGTLDGDGQWDPGELGAVLEPVVADRADLVLGSRRLGRDETTSRFRRAGVRVFAGLASLLSGQRVTDTSTGLRAMRAELTASVRLTQPQYETSELLMGALAHGYRVTEAPITMHQRTAGESHKGNDLLYGIRYGCVLVGTWLRERASAPGASGAASSALRNSQRS